MEKKLAELTDKIYREGVEKGEEEKKNILDSARKEAEKIISDATAEAEKIVASGESKASELIRNGESELKLASKQALSALKQQIIDVVAAKSLDEETSDALKVSTVLEKAIVEIAGNWNDKGASLEVLLSEASLAELKKSIEAKAKKVLDGSITIKGSKSIAAGFKIGPDGGAYKLSLTDEDFAEFFKEYLRPVTRKLLFEE